MYFGIVIILQYMTVRPLRWMSPKRSYCHILASQTDLNTHFPNKKTRRKENIAPSPTLPFIQRSLQPALIKLKILSNLTCCKRTSCLG